jgi:CBS domain-containing protein
VMTHVIIVCREDDDLSSAIAAMEEYQIRRVPVIDSGGCLVGIVSQADVATGFQVTLKCAEIVEETSLAA